MGIVGENVEMYDGRMIEDGTPAQRQEVDTQRDLTTARTEDVDRLRSAMEQAQQTQGEGFTLRPFQQQLGLTTPTDFGRTEEAVGRTRGEGR